jgi:5-hydroxyisourate hydrolase
VSISTHILDTALGRPAAGVSVMLYFVKDGEFVPVGLGSTDKDGRCGALLAAPHSLEAGLYKMVFSTGDYYERIGKQGLYPVVEITFEVREGETHYHIPLLLTPNSYTTYRGS